MTSVSNLHSMCDQIFLCRSDLRIMQTNQSYLFKERRFLPIFIVQFCGCLNDSILKNALIILIAFKLAGTMHEHAQNLILLANAIFMLPFIVFASLAGQLADKYERTTLIKYIKLFEILIILIAAHGFYTNNLITIFSCIGLMGIHSTFFGPIKYSVLPDHMAKGELLSANGYVEAGTFISILIGTIIGGFYNSHGYLIIIGALIAAVIGFVASYFVPKSGNSNLDIKINYNLVRENYGILKYAHSKKHVFLSILGISWFWFIGAAILAQIPALTRDVLKADEGVANLFLAIFSIGVGVGSLSASKLFKNEITAKYVFLASLGISLFGIDLFFETRKAALSYEPEQLRNILVYLSKFHNWRILIDLFFLATISGLYIVPLFAVMQHFSLPSFRSRIIAANNLMNSLFMVASTLILSILFYLNFTIPSAILFISLINIIVAFYIYKLLPDAKIVPIQLLKIIIKAVFNKMYRVEVKNIDNFYKAGEKVVIIANHLSYLDSALLSLYLPEDLTFAINTTVAKSWWVRPFLKIVKTFPVDSSNAMSVKTLINEVKRNRKIAIFPEGRMSLTGSLMKIYEGPGMIADRAKAVILPIRIDGTQFTHFSKLKNILGRKLFPKVTISILPPVKFTLPDEMDNRLRRKNISQILYEVMTDMMFESSDYKKTLFKSLIEAARLYGYGREIMHDINGNMTSYRGLLFRSFILSNLIFKESKNSTYTGLLMPNTVAMTICFYAMQASGLVPTMINFTSGISSIISSCKTTNIKVIYTSRQFIIKAELSELIKSLIEENIKIVFLEDLKEQVSLWLKIKSLFGLYFPELYYHKICRIRKPCAAAVILFTSGTEGQPKAVVLSHINLQANRCQVLAKVDFSPHDVAFNALPMFHCFGLTATIIMSLTGIRTFFYPSPLHYRIIPEVIYDVAATIMFGTDTFLTGYTKYAHPYDFYSLRYIFAGAEKLRSKTRQLWLDKYGIRIFEGYGITEAAPVIAANTSMHELPGSVGKLMPKIEYHLEPVEGIKEGGRLFIKGPNVMMGYIKADEPGIIKAPFSEKLGKLWYDTGDIVRIDEDKYITILGRAKRFAKIAGEMISLSAVEELAGKIDHEHLHAAVHLEDSRKGEQIWLFSASIKVTKDTFVTAVKEARSSELYIPKVIINLSDLPVLATGKIDYQRIMKIALEKQLAIGAHEESEKIAI